MTTPTLDNQLCFALYSASNAIVRLYRPLLEPFELTYPQFLLMLALWQKDHVSMKALSRRTRLDPGTLTPIVKRLEGKGLLKRLPDPADERVKFVVLTKEGQAMKVPLFKAKAEMQSELVMDEASLMQLRHQCMTLLEQVEEKLGK